MLLFNRPLGSFVATVLAQVLAGILDGAVGLAEADCCRGALRHHLLLRLAQCCVTSTLLKHHGLIFTQKVKRHNHLPFLLNEIFFFRIRNDVKPPGTDNDPAIGRKVIPLSLVALQ